MRAFIAIELSERIQDILYRTCLELGGRPLPRSMVRWVKPASIHLTIRFLGDIQPALIPQIGQAIDQNVARLPTFDLELNELGCFPNSRKPRIIWVGLRGETGKLKRLHSLIESELVAFGWESERRPYFPHLTIGRVKDQRAMVKANLPYGQKIESPSFSVTSVSLIESVLKPEGASYISRYNCLLGAAFNSP